MYEFYNQSFKVNATRMRKHLVRDCSRCPEVVKAKYANQFATSSLKLKSDILHHNVCTSASHSEMPAATRVCNGRIHCLTIPQNAERYIMWHPHNTGRHTVHVHSCWCDQHVEVYTICSLQWQARSHAQFSLLSAFWCNFKGLLCRNYGLNQKPKTTCFV